MSKEHLTERQREFCALYVGGAKHNAALAARMAGYAAASSHVTGCQLLKMHKIAAVVRELENLAAKALGVTRQRVINELQEAAIMAKIKADPMAMIAAWKAIAQAAGLDRPEKTVERRPMTKKIHRMESMTDAELHDLISAAGLHRRG